MQQVHILKFLSALTPLPRRFESINQKALNISFVNNAYMLIST